MRTTIYWFTTDDDGGTNTELFATEAQQKAAHDKFVRDCWRCKMDEPCPDDLEDAWDKLTSQCGFIDSCNWGEEEIELQITQAQALESFAQPNHPAVAVARRVYSSDDCEIDDMPLISENKEDGTWVGAWVFVHEEEIGS